MYAPKTAIDLFSKSCKHILNLGRVRRRRLKFKFLKYVEEGIKVLTGVSEEELFRTDPYSFGILAEAYRIISRIIKTPETKTGKIELARAFIRHYRNSNRTEEYYKIPIVTYLIHNFSNCSGYENEDRDILYEATEISAEIFNRHYFLYNISNIRHFVSDLPYILNLFLQWKPNSQNNKEIFDAARNMAKAIEKYSHTFRWMGETNQLYIKFHVIKQLYRWYRYDNNNETFLVAAFSITPYLLNKDEVETLRTMRFGVVVICFLYIRNWFAVKSAEALRKGGLTILDVIIKRLQSQDFFPKLNYLCTISECITKMFKYEKTDLVRNGFLTLVKYLDSRLYAIHTLTQLAGLTKRLTKYYQIWGPDDYIRKITLELADVFLVNANKFMSRPCDFSSLSDLLQAFCYWRHRDNDSNLIRRAVEQIASVFVFKYKDSRECSSENIYNFQETAHAVDPEGDGSNFENDTSTSEEEFTMHVPINAVPDQNVEQVVRDQTNVGNATNVGSMDKREVENVAEKKNRSSESSGSDSKLNLPFNAFSDNSGKNEHFTPKNIAAFACRLSTWYGSDFGDVLFTAMNLVAKIVAHNSGNNGIDLKSCDEQDLNLLMYAFTKWKKDDGIIKTAVVAIAEVLGNLDSSGKLKDFSIRILARLAKYLSQWQRYHNDDIFSCIIVKIAKTVETIYSEAEKPLNHKLSDLVDLADAFSLVSGTEIAINPFNGAIDIIAKLFYEGFSIQSQLISYLPRYLRKLAVVFRKFYEVNKHDSINEALKAISLYISYEHYQNKLEDFSIKDLAVLSDAFINWLGENHMLLSTIHIADTVIHRHKKGILDFHIESLSLLTKAFAVWRDLDVDRKLQEATIAIADIILNDLKSRFTPYNLQALTLLSLSFNEWLINGAPTEIPPAIQAIAFNITLQFVVKVVRGSTLEEFGKVATELSDFKEYTECICCISTAIVNNTVDSLREVSNETLSNFIIAIAKCYNNGNESRDILVHATSTLLERAIGNVNTLNYVSGKILPYKEELYNMINVYINEIALRRSVLTIKEMLQYIFEIKLKLYNHKTGQKLN